MRIPSKTFMSGLVGAFLLLVFFAASAYSVTSEVVPDRIEIGSFYHGSNVVVTGEVEAGKDIIIQFSSPGKEAHFRKKGKTGGLLWMNVGELEFKPVSDLYLIYSTKDINAILSPDQQDKFMLGYDAFRRRVEVSPISDESEKTKWVNEFIKFKEKNRIYGIFTGEIETKTDGDRETFKLSIDWPYQALPQNYTVSVYAVKNNKVQDYTQSSLNVEKVGALKFLSNMAYNKAMIYGVVSILIAFAAGFIVSVMFKGGGGSH
ncbi:MAG: TIGR02186 family protein [Nitrospirota bacterium]|nr:TIGR02186 family protein [Nitrospirota bacterium]